MTAQNNLEHHGTFAAHPFAELLVEIMQAKFSGSLRLTHENQKSIIYFRGGEVVYAVSNSKTLRLFNLLLRKNKIDAKAISRHANFANDMEFAKTLITDGAVNKEDIDETFTAQMQEIVVDVLTWSGGEWEFSPLVRARDDLFYAIDAYQVLIDYARCANGEHVFNRFKSVKESFAFVPERRESANLQAHEAFVLARFEGQPLTIEQLRTMCTMPEGGILQALYVLWLGGLLVRRDWNAAFNDLKIGEILSARVAKVKDASDMTEPQIKSVPAADVNVDAPIPEIEKERLPEIKISLEEYLTQIESSETHYDSLGIEVNADAATIKHAYFSLAKLFHPDKYHRETAEVLRRIQSAFTVLAYAHETLKSPDARDAYNAKMYREIEAREKRRAAGQPDITDASGRTAEQGLESFEEGLNMLNEEEYEAAVAYLGRAVHYSPQNALYHAYFGRALAGVDDKKRHKAESELQTAVRLDPKNPKVRLMLVEFLVELNMLKRAEGELKRFLELVPNNKEALLMLAKIKA